MNKRVDNLEIILNKLINEFESGYGFTKNSRDLLEQLTEYKQHYPNNKLDITLHQKTS